jgi:hypothetical protein
MKKTLIALNLLAASALFIGGCATSDTGAYVPVNTSVNNLEDHELIVLLDPRVQNSVTCTGIQQRPTEDGRLEVTANLRNRENRRIQVQASCVFKNEQGFPSEGEDAPFQNVILTENGQESVHWISFNNQARRYTIRIREAH